MSKTLTEIAQQLKNANKKVQLIYAFNGVGKTRLSQEFKQFIAPKSDDENGELARNKILYYNSFTEDLFYWDNDLEGDAERKLKIQPNTFTDWILRIRGDAAIVKNFQRYTNDKITPRFQEEDVVRAGKKTGEKTYPEVTFSLDTGTERTDYLKISKGEENNFVWSIFYSLLEEVVDVLNNPEPNDRETERFDQLEYVFIDDPVSSLDENHLIELAVNLAELVKSCDYSNGQGVRFIITTHSPLFYNVLHNEFNNDDKKYNYKKKWFEKYRFIKYENGTYQLETQPNDSPFSYHLYLKAELEKAANSGQIKKYHFNLLRNILEKTSTFLGYTHWTNLLPQNSDGKTNPYESRIINISSHSKHAGEEVAELTEDDKRVLGYLVNEVGNIYRLEHIKKQSK